MARTEEQNEQMRAARKEKILVEALHQFATKGLLATRIQDIAKGAGMAQGLLYHYYPSKEAIYVDLVSDAMDKLNAATQGLLDMEAPARDKILIGLREIFKTIQSSERFRLTSRLIAQATNTLEISPAAYATLQAKRDLPYGMMAAIMRQGQDEGSVVAGDPAALAILFWTSVSGLATYYVARPDVPFTLDYRLLAALFLRDRAFLDE